MDCFYSIFQNTELAWYITEEAVFTKIPLRLSFLSIITILGPPVILVTETQDKESIYKLNQCIEPLMKSKIIKTKTYICIK